MRVIVYWILRIFYRLRVEGREVLEAPGPLLLAPNHVSWLDWLFLGAILGEDWRFVTSKATAQSTWIHRKIMVNRRTFPVDPNSPYAVREMAEFLQRGGKLVLFPEGRITRTGGLMKIYDGCGFLLQRTPARLIVAYLQGAVRVPWVRHEGATTWFPQVSVHFGRVQVPPRYEGISAMEARRRCVHWLHEQMTSLRFEVENQYGPTSIPEALAEWIRLSPKKEILEDVTGSALTYRRLGVGANLLAAQWRKRLDSSAPRTGVLLPNVNAMPVVLLSLWQAGRVPAILNFSTGLKVLVQCCELAGVKDLITSSLFLEKAKIDAGELERAGLRLHRLEEIRPLIPGWLKLATLVLHSTLGFRAKRIQKSDTAVVLFTSGSEGVPKGVELSHGNLLANVRQLESVLDVTEKDTILNALPLFHSFGLVGGTLFPFLHGCKVYLYPSPLHYRTIPAFAYDRGCTMLLGTNTFLNGYARKAHAYDFCSVRLVLAGAEKVLSQTFDEWARRFGVRILEGYGATECSPVIAVNTRQWNRQGSVGRLLPGLEARLEPVDGVPTGGRLWVRGPNVMKGYLNAEAQRAFLAGEGWYDTGDVATLDVDGFLTLQGRMKRFAKISGEMVSLTAVEEALAKVAEPRGPRVQAVVVAIPDAEKGERLLAVTNDPKITLADLRAGVRAAGLSNLCAPRAVYCLQPIPKLGTGKTDYLALKEWVMTEVAKENA